MIEMRKHFLKMQCHFFIFKKVTSGMYRDVGCFKLIHFHEEPMVKQELLF